MNERFESFVSEKFENHKINEIYAILRDKIGEI